MKPASGRNRDNELRAVGLLTAWAGAGRSTDFLIEQLRAESASSEEFNSLFVGLFNVAGDMLVLLSNRTNKSEEQLLQELALRYNRLAFPEE